MFTGLIEAIGKVVKCDGETLLVCVPLRAVRLGESISVEGVCLTVKRKTAFGVAFDLGPETRRVTTLSRLTPGSSVNLERALRIGDRVGGHWVTGHVESTGRIESLKSSGRNRWISIGIPRTLVRYMMPKGSVTVDGISLTVVSIQGSQVKLMLIPHTLKHTTLGRKKAGDAVNVEPDLIAKYALAHRGAARSTKALKRLLRP
jgi:riboflavin synthase alpha subunit